MQNAAFIPRYVFRRDQPRLLAVTYPKHKMTTYKTLQHLPIEQQHDVLQLFSREIQRKRVEGSDFTLDEMECLRAEIESIAGEKALGLDLIVEWADRQMEMATDQ